MKVILGEVPKASVFIIVSSILLSFGINISITIELLFLLYNVSCLCSVFIYLQM